LGGGKRLGELEILPKTQFFGKFVESFFEKATPAVIDLIPSQTKSKPDPAP
jgi:hypothetical protein